MNSIVKNTFILTVITLISGLLLGIVYQVTKEPIANQEEKIKVEAYQDVIEDATVFEEKEFNADNTKNVLEANGFFSDADITGIVYAFDDSEKHLGYVITVQSHEGYGGNIDVTVGINLDGTVLGVEITSISETAGLGMRANTDEFKSQFANKNVDLFKYSKTGASSDDEIDALSGATITTNAMTNAVNAALICSKNIEGGNLIYAE